MATTARSPRQERVRPTSRQEATSPVVLRIGAAGCADVATVGGKGASLCSMKRAGLPVPDGFILTTEAYRRFLDAGDITRQIDAALRGYDPSDPGTAADVSRVLQGVLTRSELPDQLLVELLDAYGRLSASGAMDTRVAVRSSAVSEDSAGHSFAGQFESYLNVQGADDVVAHAKLCWASAFTPRALAYRTRHALAHDVPMAVVIQVMADADKSGVMFTADPSTADASRLIIEAAWGLGEAVVQGMVTPDHVELDRESRAIVHEQVSTKECMLSWNAAARRNTTVDLSRDPRSTAPVLVASDLALLAGLAERVERLYGARQDVEFAIVGGDVCLTQCRPLTTGGAVSPAMNDVKPGVDEGTGAGSKPSEAEQARATSGQGHSNVRAVHDAHAVPTGDAALPTRCVRGFPASPGRASGAARVLQQAVEGAQLLDGEVLVTRMTTPDWVPAMSRAAAIVTDAGGMTSHAAIVARELGIPCVVGTGDATRRIATGAVVTVDGAAGTVEDGQSIAAPDAAPVPAAVRGPAGGAVAITATHLFVNLAEPRRAAEVAAGDVDGVGLLRAEFMLLSALDGYHPREFLAREGADAIVTRLCEPLRTIAAAFHPRPVTYRAMDFRSNEFRNLRGGDAHEPIEENPMIGYRGCFRYGREPELFAAELRALAEVRERFDNLHLMIPFVRTPRDLAACLRLVDASPLGAHAGMKRWIMAEVPSVVHRLREYAAMGIDGVSIGSNDLTQLMLGIDRDSEMLASLWDERDASVLEAIRAIITQCRELGLTSSICGQAPSVHPEYTQRLVEWGIDSISVNPDAIPRTRRSIATAERRMMLDMARREGIRLHQRSH